MAAYIYIYRAKLEHSCNALRCYKIYCNGTNQIITDLHTDD